MLQSDKLKLEIVKTLRAKGPRTLGQLMRDTNIGHRYTLLNSIEFLKEVGIVELLHKKDRLGTKIVRLTKNPNMTS